MEPNQTSTEVAPGVHIDHKPGAVTPEARAKKRIARDRKVMERAAKKVEKVFKGAKLLSKAEAAKAVKQALEDGRKIGKAVAAAVDLRKVPAAARPAPSSGQSGAPMELLYAPDPKRPRVASCTADQKRILGKLNGDGKGGREDLAVADLAIGGKDETGSGARQDLLRARNAMRNLLRGGWAEKRGRGVFRITTAGRDRLAKAGA